MLKQCGHLRLTVVKLRSKKIFKLVPFEVVHRAAFELAEDRRRYEVWQDCFEEEYGVRFRVPEVPAYDHYGLEFEDEHHYMMFLLKWT